MTYITDFISAQEQDLLLAQIDQEPLLTNLGRRVQYYGYNYNYKARPVRSGAYSSGPVPD